MNEILKTTLIGLFFGTFGTTIGGIIGVKFKNPSKKILSFILAFASGLMLAIVCFDLLPEAFNLTNLPTAFLGIFLGIVMMIICDLLVDKKFNKSTRFKDSKNALLKTGIVVSIGLALHNLPEGISMAVPMKNGGMKKSKVIFYVVLSGVTTGIGAFLGALVGGISQSIIAMCLAFAAGAMIYIVSGELTPEANNLYHGRMTAVGSMLGLLIGIFAMSI